MKPLILYPIGADQGLSPPSEGIRYGELPPESSPTLEEVAPATPHNLMEVSR